MTNTTQRGAIIERRAAAYLEGKGLTLIERNFRCKMGEIDLIMRDREHLVFVEVRFRKQNDYGLPVATVGARKQSKLIKSAQFYLNLTGLDLPCRFDVLGITGSGRPDWIKDAFSG